MLLSSEFGLKAIARAERYPESLFNPLDTEWQSYAQQVRRSGLGLLIPPVLGIVLTRCARREAIPAVIRDLRDEWAGPRKKVWDLLESMRTARTLGEGVEIRRDLAEASKLFAPERTEHNSLLVFLRPVCARPIYQVHHVRSAGQTVIVVFRSDVELTMNDADDSRCRRAINCEPRPEWTAGCAIP